MLVGQRLNEEVLRLVATFCLQSMKQGWSSLPGDKE